MNTEDMYRCRKIYLIIGFLFGLVFPIIAFVIRAYESNVENAIALMTIDPLLWIICMAPFILGAIAFFAGVKQDKLKIQISQCKLTESELKKANVKVTNTITELEEYNQRLKASQKTEEELHSLENAIKHFSSVIEKIGKFDLSVVVKSDDQNKSIENNHLAEVLSIALLNLQDMVNNLIDTISATHKIKESISETSSIITQGVDKQKSEIENVSFLIKELDDQISLNNEKAQFVARTSGEAYSKLVSFDKVVDQSSTSMQNISDAVQNGREIIQELSQSSKKIGNIVEIITEIANQTRLLALNASIEAARAGDAGKGFAVVADEVSKLSENTQQAVSEIADSIKVILESTDSAVQKMEEGSDEVKIGMQQMKELNSEIKVLSSELLNVVDNTEELANNNDRQNDISKTINGNIEAIELVTDSNVNNVHQIHSIIHDLDTTVERVTKIVNVFKLK